jgi:hypothetical protein
LLVAILGIQIDNFEIALRAYRDVVAFGRIEKLPLRRFKWVKDEGLEG